MVAHRKNNVKLQRKKKKKKGKQGIGKELSEEYPWIHHTERDLLNWIEKPSEIVTIKILLWTKKKEILPTCEAVNLF